MTTNEKIAQAKNEAKAEINKELNKVKSFCTRLANKLTENGIDIPKPNWQEEPQEPKS